MYCYVSLSAWLLSTTISYKTIETDVETLEDNEIFGVSAKNVASPFVRSSTPRPCLPLFDEKHLYLMPSCLGLYNRGMQTLDCG